MTRDVNAARRGPQCLPGGRGGCVVVSMLLPLQGLSPIHGGRLNWTDGILNRCPVSPRLVKLWLFTFSASSISIQQRFNWSCNCSILTSLFYSMSQYYMETLFCFWMTVIVSKETRSELRPIDVDNHLMPSSSNTCSRRCCCWCYPRFPSYLGHSPSPPHLPSALFFRKVHIHPNSTTR